MLSQGRFSYEHGRLSSHREHCNHEKEDQDA